MKMQYRFMKTYGEDNCLMFPTQAGQPSSIRFCVFMYSEHMYTCTEYNSRNGKIKVTHLRFNYSVSKRMSVEKVMNIENDLGFQNLSKNVLEV